MKPNIKLCSLLAGSAFLATIGAAQAQTQYYYDNNGATGGFGNAGSTWGTNNVITQSTAGTTAPANTLTTTADTLNLGTTTTGLGAGTITVGTRSIGTIIRNEGSNAGIIQLNGGTTTFAAEGALINNGGASASTILGTTLAGGATSMTFTTDGTGANFQLNAANTYAGATIVGANSQVRISSNLNDGGVNSALGSSSSAASNLILENGASLWYTVVADSTNRNFTINGATAQLQFRGSGAVTWSGTASFGGPANEAKTLSFGTSNTGLGGGTFSGLLADNGSGQLSISKFGSSTATAAHLTLDNANTFTGSTTITGGILVLGNANAIQNSYINTTSSATGTATTGLRTTGAALNLGGLSGNKNLADIYTSSTGGYDSVTGITLNVASANNISYAGVIDGGRSLTKTGAGTQTLTSTNTYSGATLVSGGTLAVNGSLANTSSVTVGSTGTLQGSGVVISSITIQNGGTLAPGNSIESLASGNLSFEAGSTYAYEIHTNLHGSDPEAAADLTYSTGTLDITAGAILTLNDLAASVALADGTKFTLISYFGGWTGSELFSYDSGSGLATLADDSTFTLGANQWRFDYNDATGGLNFADDQVGASSFVTMTVIPEPRAALLGCFGVLLLLRRRR